MYYSSFDIGKTSCVSGRWVISEKCFSEFVEIALVKLREKLFGEVELVGLASGRGSGTSGSRCLLSCRAGLACMYFISAPAIKTEAL